MDWLRQYSKEQDETYVRGFLGRMLFSGEEALKKVNVLSGGEKVRCVLSKIMLSGANLLIFDEPTNHLDMESITALNEGMSRFKGIILFTSHDHQLTQTVANKIIDLKPEGVDVYKRQVYIFLKSHYKSYFQLYLKLTLKQELYTQSTLIYRLSLIHI